MQLQVLREGEVISTFDIDEGTVYVGKLNDARKITCPVKSHIVLDLQEGDYIIHKDEVYIISNLPEFEKDGSVLQKSYNITFEHELYLLLDTFVVNDQGLGIFPLYGDAEDQLNMVFNSANRNDTGWAVGEVTATTGQVINYNWTYVRTALDEIAAAFKLEWTFVGRTIRMVTQLGVDTGLTFEVGRGKGLHAIKRSADASKNVLTRVWGEGGSRNIDSTYRGGIERNLIFTGRYVETPGVTAGTERVREGRYVNEDIYPRFEGAVGSVTSEEDDEGLLIAVSIVCAAIDFDIMAQLQEGVTAKVSFRTGALTGAEFEISAYNAATHTVEFIPFADTNGYVLPNTLNMPVAGDEFTLLDLRMPSQYVVTKELELKTLTQEFLDDNKFGRLLFDVVPDEHHLRSNGIVLNEGDRATVIETDASVDEVLRFVEISYPLVNEFKVTAVVGNEITYNKVVKLFADVIQTKRDIQTIDRRSVELAKRGVKDLRSLEGSIFDTDGKFDSDKFNVGVLTAILGIFGVKSQNFKLNGVYITDNYEANNTKVAISGGELIHFEISNAGDQNIWVMTSVLATIPVTTSLYYVYAKCSRTAQVGTWVVTTAQIQPEDVAGYYHFLAGVVYPVIEGWRNSDFTNGIADINGNRLKIGKIISRDGLTGFDLDNSTIFGAITFASGSSGYNNITDKPDLSIYATEDFVDAIADDLQGQIDGSITTWFYNYQPTLANVPATDWTTIEQKNQHLGDLFYDGISGYAYRFQLVGGVYSWVKITDTDVTLALAKAQAAQDTADGKRRVFTVQPTTPYDIGDLWSQGTGGDLMRCIVTRGSGTYVSGDWGKAAKYTDDTTANAAAALALAAQQSAVDSEAAAKAYADAQDELKAIELAAYADGIVDTEEARAIADANAKLALAYADATAKAEAARVAAELAAAALVGGISVGGRNYFSSQSSIGGYNGLVGVQHVVNGNVSGFDVKNGIYSVGSNDGIGNGLLRIWEVIKSNGWWTVSGYVRSNGVGNFGFNICDLPVSDSIVYNNPGEWLYFSRTVNVTNWDESLHNFVDFENIGWQYFLLQDLKVEKGNKATDWTPAPEDVTAQAAQAASDAQAAAIAYATAQDNLKAIEAAAYADGVVDVEEARAIADATAKLAEAKADATAKANAARIAAEAAASTDAQAKADAALASANTIALGYAQSKADIAQAAAISAAASDATSKANAAKAAAEAASNSYALTAANTAASAAQVAAAADASTKATAAKVAAEATAAAAQAALTASLKGLAYQELSDLAVGGNTLITGGKVNTVLLDAAAIKANIINVDYLEALDIVAKTLAATQGTIGGWTIGATKLYSGTDPGNYIELQSGSSPRLYMRNSDQATGEYSMINSSGVFIMSNGNSLPTGYGSYNAVAAFKLKTTSSISDVALYCYAPTGVNAFICDGAASLMSSVSIIGDAFIYGTSYIQGNVVLANLTGPSGDRPLRIGANGFVYRG